MRLRAPLTERILARLGRPRRMWVLAWAILYPAAIVAVESTPSGPHLNLPPDVRLRFFMAWVLIVGFACWGCRAVYRDLTELGPLLTELLPQSARHREDPFRGVGSTRGPIVFAVLNASVFSGPEFLRSPGLPAAGLFIANLLGAMPPLTFLWVYIVLFLGLSRMGHLGLVLRPFQADRSLGVAPLGSLAFRAFLMLAAASVLLAFFGGTSDLRSTVFSIALIAAAVVFLFVSFAGMHRQLVSAKTRYLAEARHLYVQAYETLDRPISLEVLTSRAPTLNAAEALERRVAAIQEWPLSEGLITQLAAIVTGLTVAILARFILSRIGF